MAVERVFGMKLRVPLGVEPQPPDQKFALIGRKHDAAASLFSRPVDHENVARKNARIRHGVALDLNEKGRERPAHKDLVERHALVPAVRRGRWEAASRGKREALEQIARGMTADQAYPTADGRPAAFPEALGKKS